MEMPDRDPGCRAYQLAFQKFIGQKIPEANREMQKCMQETLNGERLTFKYMRDVLHRQLDVLDRAEGLLHGWDLADTNLRYPIKEFENKVRIFIVKMVREGLSKHDDTECEM